MDPDAGVAWVWTSDVDSEREFFHALIDLAYGELQTPLSIQATAQGCSGRSHARKTSIE